jgi:hypothetical protein
MAASHSTSEYPAGRIAQAACRSSATISGLFRLSLSSKPSGGLARALSASLSPSRPIQTPLLAASLINATALKDRTPNYSCPFFPAQIG